ncbi:putative odorant-binding protein A10 isoform X1 [Ceratitis capitata]|uniref:putative odorant-binding protein A10 isoform X1 n=1 Tax=Ceratitis capitata TaxID=7213 RepID=UPI00032974A7|nr:putative odorant-binding protein A10 isoform X1 [Ceratitis capitata]
MFRLIVALALILSIYHAPSVHGAPHPPTTAAPLVANQGSYDTKFDNIDLDEVLSQERLLRNYIKCLENLGPCTPDSKMLKEILPDAVSTDCAKCSEKQKLGSAKVTHFLIDNRPEDWARLEQIYDPSGNYRLAYLAEKDKGNSQSDTGEQTPSEAVTKTNEA